MENSSRNIDSEQRIAQVSKRSHEITHRLETETNPQGLEDLLPMLYEDSSTLMDYLSPQTMVLLIEPAWMAREATQLIENTKDLYERKLAFDQFMVSPNETFVSV